MVADRILRTLSVFNHSAQKWVPISSRKVEGLVTQGPSFTTRNSGASWMRLSLISWNIDAFSSRPVARAKCILDHILERPKSPDAIFLQEVTSDVRTTLLRDARVRAAFLVTDAEDRASFEGVPFATMTLLSSARFACESSPQSQSQEGWKLGCVSRVTLPSKYGRDGLCVDVIPLAPPPNTVFRLVNVHLDSLWNNQPFRAQQMKILADVLREPGCSGGIIAGDFNAICPEDEELVERNDMVDAWVALHGRAGPSGATWADAKRQDGLGRGRLDKVAMLGLKEEEMEVLRPGCIEVPRPGGESNEILWSDHCGLRCTFVA